MNSFLKTLDTRSAEILSALISLVVAVGMFTAIESSTIIGTMREANMLPEWPIVMMLSSIFCLVSQFIHSDKLALASRFVSGCIWGTVVLVFFNDLQFLPFFWISLVLLIFEIYLVTLKGQAWKRDK